MEARVLLLARAAASAAADRGAQARLPRYADLFSADDSLQRARRPRLQRPAPADRDDSDDADEREPRNGAEAAARRELQRLGAPSRKRAYSADAPAAASAPPDAARRSGLEREARRCVAAELGAALREAKRPRDGPAPAAQLASSDDDSTTDDDADPHALFVAQLWTL
ncbi:hypothetical protein JL722_13801 [Aureococcus anophagefferens]|nr:hypothetical protein JL722_13801 [Aureococcus anophagefferens]